MSTTGPHTAPSLEEQLLRTEDAAEYAAAQALRDTQDHRDDADLRSYRPGSTS